MIWATAKSTEVKRFQMARPSRASRSDADPAGDEAHAAEGVATNV
jgi:hypothetical protein